MRVLLSLLLLVISEYNVLGADERYCYVTDPDQSQNKHFSTKTSYDLVKGKEPESSRALNVPQGCRATKIWILSRHGTRLPDKSFIKSMKGLNSIKNEIIRNQNQLCTPDLIDLKVWKVNTSITPDKEEELTPQGFEELRLLGNRLYREFPEIFLQPYSKDKYHLYTSNSNRTRESLQAFATGIFGYQVAKEVYPRVLNDSFLRPYDVCDLYKARNEDEKNNPESEIRKFESSELLTSTVSQIAHRLGFPSLNNENVYLMWDMCRYERAWYVSRHSIWCAVLTKLQNKVLEYRQDLKYYRKNGYASDLNPRMACYTVQDMLKHFENNDQPHAVAYFSHSAMLQLFLVALGAFKDKEPLRADNFEQMENREWQTSSIAPFTGNVIAVKYDCPSDSNDPKILFLHNEKPLNIEGCKLGLCDLSYILKKYEETYNANCQEYFCSVAGDKIQLSKHLIIITPFITYLMYSIIAKF